eukprot:896004-Rhodomonas_salina.2
MLYWWHATLPEERGGWWRKGERWRERNREREVGRRQIEEREERESGMEDGKGRRGEGRGKERE